MLTLLSNNIDPWVTPAQAITKEFLSQIPRGLKYIEPCAGDGSIIKSMKDHARCRFACDINPRHPSVIQRDCFDITNAELGGAKTVITNTPFDQHFVRQFVQHFNVRGLSVWLILPAEFMFKAKVGDIMSACEIIVPIGALQWFPNTESRGWRLYGWYKFVPNTPRLRVIYKNR